jgi:hypothetical protein
VVVFIVSERYSVDTRESRRYQLVSECQPDSALTACADSGPPQP